MHQGPLEQVTILGSARDLRLQELANGRILDGPQNIEPVLLLARSRDAGDDTADLLDLFSAR